MAINCFAKLKGGLSVKKIKFTYSSVLYSQKELMKRNNALVKYIDRTCFFNEPSTL